ncbi:uncharacterized protein [Leptinotarsa decemlineata]|uniref:uncharacterized protein n=1 Tax=Leptinotarsa decemlineata TaxID=7539 RepID=UPI003D30C38D
MDKIRTVACIDTSGSTFSNEEYFNTVNSLIGDAFKVITWNSYAYEINSNVLDKYQAGGSTLPQTFLEILKTYDFKYQLIVTTDGQMYDHDIVKCEAILMNSNILNSIEHFKIYYIGEESEMNMKMDNLFTSPKFNKEIFINEKVTCTVDINIDFDKVCVKDITEKNDFKASIISRLSRFPEESLDLRSKVCKLSNRLLSELVDESVSVKTFFENKDVAGCTKFIKNGSVTEKKVLQQKISDILNLFKNDTDIYKLSHLSNTHTLQEVEVSVPFEEGDEEDDEEDIEKSDDAIFCDIMFTKCTHLCLLIRKPEVTIIPDDISKQISIHPFSILSHEDIIKKILDLVEFQQIDLSSYSQLENKYISPFTRHQLKGVYIFNSGTDDVNFELVRKNNNRVISVIFGPGNKLQETKLSGMFSSFTFS